MLRKLLPLTILALLVAVTALAQTTPKGSDTFDDVPEGHWADEAIGWAVENGITSGVSDTEFGMGRTVTREQIVTFLWKYDKSVRDVPTTAPPTTTTKTTTVPTVCNGIVCPTDQYSYERFSTTYWVFEFVTGRSCSSLYVEVQLLDANERRIGDWSNELVYDVASGEKIVVEVSSDSVWSFYEWEVNCR